MNNIIAMTQSVYRDYKCTIAKHEPETIALLGGRLDKPNLITDFRFCPPRKVNGKYDSSSASVFPDSDLMNWVILNEWMPNGKYMLGFWHSHPGNITAPSGMNGDLGAWNDCLSTDHAIKNGWSTALAPITTFDKNNDDTVHGWTYERGATSAKPAEIKIIEDEKTIINVPDETASISETPIKDLVSDMAAARQIIAEYRGLNWLERQVLRYRYSRMERALFKEYSL